MTNATLYRSQAPAGRAGFARLVHAEWTKFRTVRGWVVGMIVAGLLVVGVVLLGHSECGGMQADGSIAPGGDRFGAGAGNAGEVLGAVVAADSGDKNGEDADCRAGKESSDGDERDGECHDVTRLPLPTVGRNDCGQTG
jgi:hypothetical protein